MLTNGVMLGCVRALRNLQTLEGLDRRGSQRLGRTNKLTTCELVINTMVENEVASCPKWEPSAF